MCIYIYIYFTIDKEWDRHLKAKRGGSENFTVKEYLLTEKKFQDDHSTKNLHKRRHSERT